MTLREIDDLCASRRSVLRALASVGVTTIAAGVLVACGSDSSDDAGSGGSDDPTSDPTSDAASDPTSDATSDAGAAPQGSVAAADVPVGEARVVDLGGERVVLAQPAAGEFVAFGAACTHMGTEVGVDGGLNLLCPNHGSRFDAATGEVQNGPATTGLPSLQVTVEGDFVVLA